VLKARTGIRIFPILVHFCQRTLSARLPFPITESIPALSLPLALPAVLNFLFCGHPASDRDMGRILTRLGTPLRSPVHRHSSVPFACRGPRQIQQPSGWLVRSTRDQTRARFTFGYMCAPAFRGSGLSRSLRPLSALTAAYLQRSKHNTEEMSDAFA
jgi:hypothetical protein